MAGWRHMESKKEIRSSFIIVRLGSFFVVRRVHKPVGGRFMSEQDAKNFVDKRVNELYNRAYELELKRIRKIPDLKKRCREYRKLCQIQDTSSPLS